MEMKTHPTHARSTKNAMVGLGVVAMACWAMAMAIGQNDQNPQIVNVLALTGVTSGFGILMLASLRAFLMQCPTCKQLLTKQVSVHKETATRKFCCVRCNVIWDSKVQYEFGGD